MSDRQINQERAAALYLAHLGRRQGRRRRKNQPAGWRPISNVISH